MSVDTPENESTDTVLELVPAYMKGLDELETVLCESTALAVEMVSKNLVKFDPSPWGPDFPDHWAKHCDPKCIKRLRGKARNLATRISSFVQQLSQIEPLLQDLQRATVLLGVAAGRLGVSPEPLHQLTGHWSRENLRRARTTAATIRSLASADRAGRKPEVTTAPTLGPAHLEPHRHGSRYRAYVLFQYAEDVEGRDLTDREAYAVLKGKGVADDDKYELPSFETFTRYCTAMRKQYGTSKYTPRGGRSSPSVRTSDEF